MLADLCNAVGATVGGKRRVAREAPACHAATRSSQKPCARARAKRRAHTSALARIFNLGVLVPPCPSGAKGEIALSLLGVSKESGFDIGSDCGCNGSRRVQSR